jgi:hypothetical protein
MVALYYSARLSGELEVASIVYCHVYHLESRGDGVAYSCHHLHHLQARLQRLDA